MISESPSINIALHATHETAESMGGIRTVIRRVVDSAPYRARFDETILLGPAPATIGQLLAADPHCTVLFDSARPPAATDDRALRGLTQAFGGRLMHARVDSGGAAVHLLLCVPDGVRVSALEPTWRHARSCGFDIDAYAEYPAIVPGIDRRLVRAAGLDPRPDVPPACLLDHHGRPLPGGAATVVGAGSARLSFPRLTSLSGFGELERVNPYLIELQYHFAAAPLLWAAARSLVARQPSARATLFAHDWMSVPTLLASEAAGERPEDTIYIAHETPIFRLMAEGGLQDHQEAIAPRHLLDGHDVGLLPLLAEARARCADLRALFPDANGFRRVMTHHLSTLAARFDRRVAVGAGVADELRCVLGDHRVEAVEVIPNGLPVEAPPADAVQSARDRVDAIFAARFGWRPDVLLLSAHRAVISKAPWRWLDLYRCIVDASRERGLKVGAVWVMAGRRTEPAQQALWASRYGWPLAHRGEPDGDLSVMESALWSAGERTTDAGAMILINAFLAPGMAPGALGSLYPADAPGLYPDLQLAADANIGLSVYEPFGLSALESLASGALSVLSDAFGAVEHLGEAGLGELVLVADYGARGAVGAGAARRRAVEAEVHAELAPMILRRVGSGEEKARLRAMRRAQFAASSAKLSWRTAVERLLAPIEQGP